MLLIFVTNSGRFIKKFPYYDFKKQIFYHSNDDCRCADDSGSRLF